jgi:HNH endonuclease
MTVARPMEERFWEKVDKNGPVPVNRPELGPCWLWTAYIKENGYGTFAIRHGVVVHAHRLAYELCVGPIPKGKDLDHLCRVRRCINPKHTEPVTRLVNVARGDGAPKSHCKNGHLMSGDNLRIVSTTGHRYCGECNRQKAEANRRKAGILPKYTVTGGTHEQHTATN